MMAFSAVDKSLPHHWKAVHFNRPTWCTICQRFIVGVFGKQGVMCTVCKIPAHKSCSRRDGATSGCISEQINLYQVCGHSFERETFNKPTWCSHCGEFLWGKTKQGCRCKSCHVVLHVKCLLALKTFCTAKPISSVELLKKQEVRIVDDLNCATSNLLTSIENNRLDLIQEYRSDLHMLLSTLAVDREGRDADLEKSVTAAVERAYMAMQKLSERERKQAIRESMEAEKLPLPADYEDGDHGASTASTLSQKSESCGETSALDEECASLSPSSAADAEEATRLNTNDERVHLPGDDGKDCSGTEIKDAVDPPKSLDSDRGRLKIVPATTTSDSSLVPPVSQRSRSRSPSPRRFLVGDHRVG